MMFHITYQFSTDHRKASQNRFKETGAPPVAGITMHGRWHCAQSHKGFLIVESDEAEAIATWIQQWSDLMTFEVTPVITDEELARVID